MSNKEKYFYGHGVIVTLENGLVSTLFDRGEVIATGKGWAEYSSIDNQARELAESRMGF